MKIGFDAKRAYHNYTGLGNYSRDLIKNLLDYYPNNQYILYSPKLANNPRFKFIEGKENVEVKYPETQFHKTFKGLWRSINLEKFLIQDEIKIYHGLSNEIPRKQKFKNNGIKYVVTIHDLIFKRYPRTYRSIDRRIYNVKFKYAAKNSDLVIAISEQTKKDIIDYYGVDPQKIKVIYQTCHSNFRKEYSQSEMDEVKKKYNLPDKYLLNVGTIETRKNLHALLQAIPLMKNDLPIYVVGKKTKYFNFIKVQMQKLKIPEGRIHFLHGVNIKELPVFYKQATAFVYPSLFEGFGIPIIEALYSKTPVVTTQGGCFPEAGGPDSLYVDTKNYEELANAIDTLIQDKEKMKTMGEKGWDYAQRFNPDVLTNQLMNLYRSL